MKRSPLIAGVVVMAAMSTLWLLLRAADPDPFQPTQPTPGEQVRAAGVPGLASSGESEPPADRAAVLRSQVASSDAAHEVEATGAALMLHGTFTVVDVHGVAGPAAPGEFRAVIRQSENSSTYDTVEVRDGKWQCLVEEMPRQLEVKHARVGERLVACQQIVPITDASVSIALRGQFLPTMQLRVVDGESGLDLSGVRLVMVPNVHGPHIDPRGRHVNTVVARAASPLQVEVPVIERAQTFWARAPGYAWGKIKLDTRNGRPRLLPLRAGGDVVVTVEDAVVPVVSRLRVRRAGAPSSAPVADLACISLRSFIPDATIAPFTVAVEGLAVGEWLIRIEEGPWQAPLVHGSASVTVVSNAAAATTIKLKGSESARMTAAVSGTLRVPAAWGRAVNLSISVRGRGHSRFRSSYYATPGQMRRLADGAFAFDAGLLPVGDYQVYLHGTQYRTSFALPVAGRRDLLFVVPEPCRVHLRLLDAETNLSLSHAESARWFCKPDGWLGACESEEVLAGDDGSFRCSVPSGRVTFGVHPEGYRAAEQSFEVRAGNNEFVLRVQRDFGVEVTLMDGEHELPWPDDLVVQLLDREGKSMVSGTRGNRIGAVRPGECSLSLSGIAGFEPVATQQVVVGSWQWAKVSVVLRRKP